MSPHLAGTPVATLAPTHVLEKHLLLLRRIAVGPVQRRTYAVLACAVAGSASTIPCRFLSRPDLDPQQLEQGFACRYAAMVRVVGSFVRYVYEIDAIGPYLPRQRRSLPGLGFVPGAARQTSVCRNLSPNGRERGIELLGSLPPEGPDESRSAPFPKFQSSSANSELRRNLRNRAVAAD